MSARLDILVVSNLWPAGADDGYALGARDVAARLARRGHRITVLTSPAGTDGADGDGAVYRLLHERFRWQYLPPRALVAETLRCARATRAAARVVRSRRYDVVYLFGALGLNAAFIETLARGGTPLVAYVADDWVHLWPRADRLFAQWVHPRPYLRTSRKIALALARRSLRRAHLLPRADDVAPIRHAQFGSHYVRALSIGRLALESEEVIPWGVDVAQLPYRERTADELSRWIAVGPVEEHLGPHVAVDAVALLRGQGRRVELTFHGDDRSEFAGALARRVVADGLGDQIRFAGPSPRERPIEGYGQAGLLVFPRLGDAPFSRTLLEAFASGLPVLTTMKGGTGELVRHDETATVCSAGSVQHLAAQFYSLIRHPERAQRIARRARAVVADRFDLDRMVDRVEAHLEEVVSGRCRPASQPAPDAWDADVTPGRSTNAIEPDAHDGGWLARLLDDLAATPGPRVLTAEVDSEPATAFPIAFPPSEVLSDRFAGYLTGRVLNAGAGSVPVRAGTTQVRLDLQPGTRPDVCADLHALPFPDASFDAVLSVAVLEHCRRPWQVMRELRRVVRTGGHIVVSVPFLQPSHANPGDFFRFTERGLRELAADAGLAVVESGTDYGTQHTLGWILLELLRYHPRHRYLFSDSRTHEWFTNFTSRPGIESVPTLASAGYVVACDTPRGEVLRPRFECRPWKVLPEVYLRFPEVPTMLSGEELRLLYWLGRYQYTGEGEVVDLGPFLGGSTSALCAGIEDNLRPLVRRPPVHSFDRFLYEPYSEVWFDRIQERLDEGQSFAHIFRRLTARFAHLIRVCEGNVITTPYEGGDIEILFVDICKSWEINAAVLATFFPHLRPGSIVVQQDYLHFYAYWLVITMDYLRDYFEYAGRVDDSHSAVFVCTRRIPNTMLRVDLRTLPIARKREAFTRAMATANGWQRIELLVACVRMLVDAGDEAAARAICREIDPASFEHPINRHSLSWVRQDFFTP